MATGMGSDFSLPPNERPAGAAPAGAVPAYPVLTVLPEVEARTPRLLGFNVEIQDYADEVNLWDWLADSGASVIREFHPEVSLRRRDPPAGAWGRIGSRRGFDAFRRRVCRSPSTAVDWANYRFGDRISWLGVPDRIIARARQAGIEPCVPMGYAPGMFPRPLVKDPERLDVPPDSGIDWEAAAGAYEYYFALMHHYASQFGVTRFMMVNEPEFRWGGFSHPAKVAALGNDWFRRLFRDPWNGEVMDLHLRGLAVQCAVLARVARWALDDVKALLAGAGADRPLTLSGPVSGKWAPFWALAEPYLDVLDYHQYSREPVAFAERYRAAAAVAARTGKDVAISEFNRQAGEMDVGETYFPMRQSVAFAEMLMSVLGMAAEGGPAIDMAALYLFHFPSTHRNYKALVYGDMNLVDWTGRDARLQGAGAEWYPTAAEMQVRFATPAYAIFRMLARCVGRRGEAGRRGAAVLKAPLTLRDSAIAPRLYDKLRTLAVERGGRLFVTILNRDEAWSDTLTLDLSALPRRWTQAVYRETSQVRSDEVTAEAAVDGGRLKVFVPPLSVVQVILSDVDPADIRDARLVERTLTPGGIANLALWQTTRLRLLARVGRKRVDLTEHNIVWASAAPTVVRVGQGGLVQRLRNSRRPVTIEARLASGRVLAGATVAGAGNA